MIGGQTLALLLTLLATPVVYSLLDELGQSRVLAWGWLPMGKLSAILTWGRPHRNGQPTQAPRVPDLDEADTKHWRPPALDAGLTSPCQ